MEAIAREARVGILMDCCEIVCIFSNNPDSLGIPIAEDLGFTTHIIPSKGKKRREYDAQVLAYLQTLDIDYIVLAGYMRLLSPVLIQAYPKRIINIHPADTKAFQGVGGYEWAWENSLELTYITVHYVDEGMDTGKIIVQQEVDLRGADSLEEVKIRGLAVEHAVYSMVLKTIFTQELQGV